MKKSVFSLILAFVAAFICTAAFSGCSASVGYTLETSEDGSKYYVARATGYTSFMSGELVIPSEYGEGDDKYPVKAIASQGFSGTSLKKITIPASVEKIGTAAFAYNNSLEEVVFDGNSSLDEIGWGIFAYCTSLESIKIPEAVETIDGMAFAFCSSLKNVYLPAGLKYINFRAFESCSALENITLPETLIQIGAFAFYNCKSLSGIILPDSLKNTEEPVLGEDGEQKKDGNGNPITQTVPALGYAAFHTCTSLKYAVLGAGITSIEEGTFGYCTSLERVYLPAGLNRIKGAMFTDDGTFVCGHAFHSDSALKEVHFAGSGPDWSAVNIDYEPCTVSGTQFDNSALLTAEKFFLSVYQ